MRVQSLRHFVLKRVVDPRLSIEKCLERSSPTTPKLYEIGIVQLLSGRYWEIRTTLGSSRELFPQTDVLPFTDDARFVLPVDTVKK